MMDWRVTGTSLEPAGASWGRSSGATGVCVLSTWCPAAPTYAVARADGRGGGQPLMTEITSFVVTNDAVCRS